MQWKECYVMFCLVYIYISIGTSGFWLRSVYDSLLLVFHWDWDDFWYRLVLIVQGYPSTFWWEPPIILDNKNSSSGRTVYPPFSILSIPIHVAFILLGFIPTAEIDRIIVSTFVSCSNSLHGTSSQIQRGWVWGVAADRFHWRAGSRRIGWIFSVALCSWYSIERNKSNGEWY